MATQARGYTATKEDLLARLARIEGQVRGVARMVEEDRYCIDVVTRSTQSEQPWTRSDSDCWTATSVTAS